MKHGSMIAALALFLGLAAPALACTQTSLRSDASPIVLAQATQSPQGNMTQQGNGQGSMAQQGNGQSNTGNAQKAGEGGGNWVGNEGSPTGATQH